MLSLHQLLTHMEGEQPVCLRFRDGPMTATRPAAEMLADATGDVLHALTVDIIRVEERRVVVWLEAGLLG